MTAGNSAIVLQLDDMVDGQPVSPAKIPLGLLNQFNQQVAKFLKGSNADLNLHDVVVSIEQGSLRLVVAHGLLLAGLASDYALLASGNLDDIDPKRAEVIEEWQKAAHKHSERSYSVGGEQQVGITINHNTAHQRQANGVWLAVEKYIHGQISDLGGVEPNLHLRLGSGQLLKVGLSKDQVLRKEQNLVYRTALLRVRAEEELTTGKLRRAVLLEFTDYRPEFNEAEFEAMTQKGRVAWSDVSSATDWVEEFRGAA